MSKVKDFFKPTSPLSAAKSAESASKKNSSKSDFRLNLFSAGDSVKIAETILALLPKQSEESTSTIPSSSKPPSEEAIDAFKSFILDYLKSEKKKLIQLANNCSIHSSLVDENAITNLDLSLSAPWRATFHSLFTLQTEQSNSTANLTLKTCITADEIWLRSVSILISPSGLRLVDPKELGLLNNKIVKLPYKDVTQIKEILKEELPKFIQEQTTNLYYCNCP